jgi:carotenoid cleavage dioxygenase
MADDKPFHLRGNYAPVSEEVTACDLPIEGALPPELSGLYVRNGANPVTGSSPHWFLGQGMLHGVRLSAGRALWYRNRYVRTPYFDDPQIQRVSSDGKFDRVASAANTHVIAHAGKLLALEEGSFPWVVDGELNTVGYHDYEGRLTTAMTAHPKLCPVTGELHAFGYGVLPPYLVYHRISADGRLVQSEEITVGGPTMIHDFAITARHVLFMDLPVVFDLAMAMEGKLPFHWSDGYPARIGVMPRAGGNADVRWFEIDPCYVFHGVNAYDEGDHIVFDVCRLRDLWRTGSSNLDPSGITLHRFRFDLAGGAVKEETLDDRAMDFPRVADARVGLEHRFGYSLRFASEKDGVRSDAALLKLDFERGTSAAHEFGASGVPGEPLFVPAAGADPKSDEGWVLSLVHDESSERTQLVVLDASAFEAKPLARIALPQRVPYGFHGSWVADPA